MTASVEKIEIYSRFPGKTQYLKMEYDDCHDCNFTRTLQGFEKIPFYSDEDDLVEIIVYRHTVDKNIYIVEVSDPHRGLITLSVTSTSNLLHCLHVCSEITKNVLISQEIKKRLYRKEK